MPSVKDCALQAGVHLLQTEGSKMVMALCQSSYNQGVYGLVTNLGSLVVRTIFFPVEEAAFRAFSRPPGNALPQSFPCAKAECRVLVTPANARFCVWQAAGSAFAAILSHAHCPPCLHVTTAGSQDPIGKLLGICVSE